MPNPAATAAISGGKGGIKTGDIGTTSARNGDFNGGTNVLNLGAQATTNPFAESILGGLGARPGLSTLASTLLIVGVTATAVLLLTKKKKR